MTFVAGGALKPIGGHILSHASATRMFLRKGTWPAESRSNECLVVCIPRWDALAYASAPQRTRGGTGGEAR